VQFEDNQSQIKKAINKDCYGMNVLSNHIFPFLNWHFPRICEELVKGEKSKDEFDNLIPLINNQFVTFIKQELYG
jgi:hypothetical protein